MCCDEVTGNGDDLQELCEAADVKNGGLLNLEHEIWANGCYSCFFFMSRGAVHEV